MPQAAHYHGPGRHHAAVRAGVLTGDFGPRRDTERQRRGFDRVRRAERRYSASLRDIARHVGKLARGYDPTDNAQAAELAQTLESYSDFIKPWARNQAARMLMDVSRRDEAVWAELGRDMSRALRDEIRNAPTGELLRGMLDEQVRLITSLPLNAAQRVHTLVLQGMAGAKRPEEVAEEIMRTGEVSIGRANLIARTEVARASSGLVMARATYVGSEGYVWETSRDSDVRPSHRKMQGKFVKWSEVPTLDNLTGHAGQLPNCRCWPRPIIPEEPE